MGRVSEGDPLVVNMKSKWILFTSLCSPVVTVKVFIIVLEKIALKQCYCPMSIYCYCLLVQTCIC